MSPPDQPSNSDSLPAELLILPYHAADGRSLLHVLIEELDSEQWTRFQAAVAFAKSTGNVPELLESLRGFAQSGGQVQLTFGADVFSGDVRGTDLAAVEKLMTELGAEPSVEVHLYHEKGRTFHPKLYLFSNEAEKTALLVVGSSNWSAGGFYGNVEANVLLRLDLRVEKHREAYDTVQGCFADFWRENT